MGMGFAPTWLHQVSPLLHKTILTTGLQNAPAHVKIFATQMLTRALFAVAYLFVYLRRGGCFVRIRFSVSEIQIRGLMTYVFSFGFGSRQKLSARDYLEARHLVET